MTREVVSTADAPAAVGPYSQAIHIGNLIFTAGQIPMEPETGRVLAESGIQEQTEQVLRNLQAVLEAGGSSLEQIVKTTVFLQNMDDFGAINEVYARFFPANPPARSAVEVARLPLGVRIEIEAIALRS
ncbi:MAG: RidA family protein [Candidatus Promineifilaceae bacterium]|nr:RidA family protein [Candidatus Promineifilaceae bacterium]